MIKLSRTTLTYLINYIPNNVEKIMYEKLITSVLSYYLSETHSNMLSGSFLFRWSVKNETR